MKRKTRNTKPYYCAPGVFGACRSKTSLGVACPGGSEHGVGTDEWYFTVVCDHNTALTLSVFGTQLHESIPADHPARNLVLNGTLRLPRGKILATCVPISLAPDMERGDVHECEHIDELAESPHASGLQAESLWGRVGLGLPSEEQPAMFWEALEDVCRSFCDFCDSDEDNEAHVNHMLAAVFP